MINTSSSFRGRRALTYEGKRKEEEHSYNRERKRNRNHTIGIWDIFALIAEEKWEAMV